VLRNTGHLGVLYHPETIRTALAECGKVASAAPDENWRGDNRAARKGEKIGVATTKPRGKAKKAQLA